MQVCGAACRAVGRACARVRAAQLAVVELAAADHVHELEWRQIPLFGAEAVKGLEFDGVIVVNPHDILSILGEKEMQRHLVDKIHNNVNQILK